MIPERAYELAKSGGWEGWKLLSVRSWQENALDPEFFQALGKALGWNSTDFGNYEAPDWLLYAHRFYDLILTGKSTDDFWKEILN